jgi:hypothetical protein
LYLKSKSHDDESINDDDDVEHDDDDVEYDDDHDTWKKIIADKALSYE